MYSGIASYPLVLLPSVSLTQYGSALAVCEAQAYPFSSLKRLCLAVCEAQRLTVLNEPAVQAKPPPYCQLHHCVEPHP